MRFHRIAYSIEPSFAAPSFCEVETKGHDTPDFVFVKDENGQRRIQLSAETILPILTAIKQLSRAAPL